MNTEKTNIVIKVPWKEFNKLAFEKLRESYSGLVEGEAKFMRTNGDEPDSTVWDEPEYVEIPI